MGSRSKLKLRSDLPHARAYHYMLDCPAWIALPQSSKALWLDLRRQLLSYNNGDISCTISLLRARGWTSTTKLARAKFALMALGFIDVTRMGGFAMGRKVCTLYRFTDVECFEIPKLGLIRRPVTRDFQEFQTVGHARDAMKAGMRALSEKAKGRRYQSRKKQVLNVDLVRPESASQISSRASRIGIEGAATGRDLGPEVAPQNLRYAA